MLIDVTGDNKVTLPLQEFFARSILEFCVFIGSTQITNRQTTEQNALTINREIGHLKRSEVRRSYSTVFCTERGEGI
jgi:hypothetical protein